MRLLIIGGSDAGISAAIRARELDATTDVHLLVADEFPNFSICGLPFYLSGEISDWRTLAHRSRVDIESMGIQLHLAQTAIRIDPAKHTVDTRTNDGQINRHGFDRLVMATGAVPIKPTITGIDLPDVFFLHTMEDSFALHQRLEAGVKSAVIIGGGYIGLEMADALRQRNLNVTLIEQLPVVMRTVDPEISVRDAALLEDHAVSMRTGSGVDRIDRCAEGLTVRCGDGFQALGDIVLLALGVRPQSQLAQACGVITTERGAIAVDREMRTNLPNIFAAGDCAVTWHRLLEKNLYLPLGTTSHKQGRIAGENAVGGSRAFGGSLGTQSVKLFDRVVAATGLRQVDAAQNGFAPFAAELSTYDHKVYYPGASELTVRLVGDVATGRLLGGQLFGAFGKEVSKRVDVLATAMHNGMRVSELNEVDLSYTPPLSSPWDPLQMAAQHWQQELAAKRGISNS